MRREEIERILKDVVYADYEWIIGGENRNWIQACFPVGDELQYTRKWYISKHACKSEVVHTALKCVLASVEHEAREAFRYKGARIFGPHFDVDELIKLCQERKIDVRPKRQEEPRVGDEFTQSAHLQWCKPG